MKARRRYMADDTYTSVMQRQYRLMRRLFFEDVVPWHTDAACAHSRHLSGCAKRA